MPINIEMNYKEDGGYEVVYPKSISDLILSSSALQREFSLSTNSVIDDAFQYINRQLNLIAHNKAGVNVYVRSVGGSPLEGVPIPNITANYDGTGSVNTDSEGRAFGYCDAGSVNIAPTACADVSYTSQSVSTVAGSMYNVEIVGTITNFVEYLSSTTVRFSNNVQNVDICCVGGGGAAGDSTGSSDRVWLGGGGAGGMSDIKYSVIPSFNENLSAIVGTGGAYVSSSQGGKGGTSSLLTSSAEGGNGGYPGTYGAGTGGNGGEGNGQGGKGFYGRYTYGNGQQGGAGTLQMFDGFNNLKKCGGGGGGGSIGSNNGGVYVPYNGAMGGSPGGGRGGYFFSYGDSANSGLPGTNGLGGGGGACGGWYNANSGFISVHGGAANGGSGIVQIRMHLKVTS